VSGARTTRSCTTCALLGDGLVVVADELRWELVAMLRTSRIEGYTRERRALLPALVC
jgi:hypothetical protein